MKCIQKRNEPDELKEWRSRNSNDINFDYELMRKDHNVVEAVTRSLLEEQGWLCAYTGLSIDEQKCHLEHLKPQKHCTGGETVLYSNIVACYPEPNTPSKLPYGAHKKDHWPAPNEQHLFVSPLDPSCESRFIFNLRGQIKSKAGDQAAAMTITKLGLDYSVLEDKRKAAIQGTIGKENDLSLKDARRRLRNLKNRQGDKLDEFCFVLVQSLEKHISRLEIIAKYKAQNKAKNSKGKNK
jgi:uncharacterized protein (TIGR02646 family)